MKNKIYIGVAAAMTMALGACNDNFELPPVYFPDWTANIEIAHLKTQYWSSDRNYVATVGTTLGAEGEQENTVIRGRVVSEMASGNIYNSIVIQGDNGGYALNVAVRTNKLTKTYDFGQEVLIDATDLQIGGYNGLMQLGAEGTYNGAPSMTFMESDVFEQHTTLVGQPDPSKVDTLVTTVAEITAAASTQEGLIKYQSRLVRFDNMTFEEPGQVYATDQNTNRYAKDAQGGRLLVRNSSYATFKNEIIPMGTGSITGILSFYGTDWQLLLNDISGVQGFTPYEPTPVEPVDPVSSINENFDASTNIPAGWTELKVEGNKAWYIATYSGNNYASMTGYKGTAPFDSWLLTPPVDMAKVTAKTLVFDTQVNGYGSTTSVFEVYVLDNPDPAKATLKDKLAPALPTAPASGYSSWLTSGTLDLSKYTGTVYIGFRYTATTDANYATWCVDNVKID